MRKTGLVLALIVFLSSILITARAVGSRTWTVDDDGPADFHTIQEAINAANPGDTIFVRKGTYSGPIVIDKTLTLEGENRESTIIDGGSNEPSGSIVLVTADNVKISGFTIQYCRGGGNAIWLDNYVNMTFSNNIITGNNEGIRILHSSGNIISHNIIRDCYYNTGLGLDWAYNNIVYGNIIENCNVGIGGNHWNNTFFENVIRDNKGGWAGWGISNNFQDCVFFHNNIINNGRQVYNTNPNPNKWDNGYPSGGNYWSDYSGVDTNGDGLGDTPYIIDANNRDRYPLVNPWIPNQPPVADAGPDQMVEQTKYGSADVTLDGSGSTDDGQLQPLTYTWTWSGGSATWVNPTVTLPLGKTTVTLTVYDGQYTDTDTVDITVRDSTPPTITVTVNPNKLWPPNHKYVDITATVKVSDICDPSPKVTLVSVTSNEPDDAKGMGDGNTVNDIVIIDNYHFKLRAERDGAGKGRIYTITYKATDASGNSATASATVTVPHDMG